MFSKYLRIQIKILTFLCGWMGSFFWGIAQTPTITVRCANPQTNCLTYEYCVDVEFLSDLPDEEVFGMNVRFFYDDDILEFIDFRDFEGGYGASAPNPPIIVTSEPAGPALFNFEGAAEFVNGGIELINGNAPPIFLDTEEWTKLFQICFFVDDPSSNPDTFCPSIVWDLEQDPANGGFLTGDDGVVITMVDPDPDNESYPADENVIQYNWEYIGNGSPPYGQPVESNCFNINCILPLTFLSFSGKETELGVSLEWHTTNEINVEGFGIGRLDAGVQLWDLLGFVPGSGTSMDQHRYTFTDRHPQTGVNFYRLEQKDLDGKVFYSPIISVNVNRHFQNQEFEIFPNPSENGILQLQFFQHADPLVLIRIYNNSGQLLKEEWVQTDQARISTRGIHPGFYVICASSGADNTCKKIIIY